MKKVRTALLSVAAAIAMASPSAAQEMGSLVFPEEVCGPMKQHRDILTRQLNEPESQLFEGVSQTGIKMTIFMSPAGAWTALLTRPDGITCLFMFGIGATLGDAEPSGEPT